MMHERKDSGSGQGSQCQDLSKREYIALMWALGIYSGGGGPCLWKV